MGHRKDMKRSGDREAVVYSDDTMEGFSEVLF